MYIGKSPDTQCLRLIMNNYKLDVSKNLPINEVYYNLVTQFKQDLINALKKYLDDELG